MCGWVGCVNISWMVQTHDFKSSKFNGSLSIVSFVIQSGNGQWSEIGFRRDKFCVRA